MVSRRSSYCCSTHTTYHLNPFTGYDCDFFLLLCSFAFGSGASDVASKAEQPSHDCRIGMLQGHPARQVQQGDLRPPGTPCGVGQQSGPPPLLLEGPVCIFVLWTATDGSPGFHATQPPSAPASGGPALAAGLHHTCDFCGLQCARGRGTEEDVSRRRSLHDQRSPHLPSAAVQGATKHFLSERTLSVSAP